MAMSTLRCDGISLGELQASLHKVGCADILCYPKIGNSQNPVSAFVNCSAFGAPRWASGGSHFRLEPATATGTDVLKWKRVTGTPGPSPSLSSCRSLIRSMAITPGPGSVELAGALFTSATAFVVPLYTIMIVAPKWEWTKRAVESNFPFVVLGALYAYLFALSFTSETLPLMFSSKYWLPELPGITRMFSSTMTVASAWVHLLAADLFAGRQIYLDGVSSGVETRHSLILCLMMCPIGIFCHIVTKSVTLFLRSASRGRDEQLTA